MTNADTKWRAGVELASCEHQVGQHGDHDGYGR